MTYSPSGLKIKQKIVQVIGGLKYKQLILINFTLFNCFFYKILFILMQVLILITLFIKDSLGYKVHYLTRPV